MSSTRSRLARGIMIGAVAAVGAAGSFAIVGVQAQPGSFYRPSGPEMMQRMCDNREARAAGDLAYLQAKVGLKPEQMVDWDKFTVATKAAVMAFNPCKDGPLPFGDPIALRARLERTIETAFDTYKSIKGAADTLTKSLDADQQRRFAEALLPPMPSPAP